MIENIYVYVELFPKCQEAMEESVQSKENHHDFYCKKVYINSDDIKTYFDEECPKFFSYLNKIDAISFSKPNLKWAACIYMYYWIFHELLKGNEKGSNSKILYENFIKAFNEMDIEKFNNFIRIVITENELEYLKNIYDMNKELDDIVNTTKKSCIDKCNSAKKCSHLYMQHKNSCTHNNNKDFCNALEKIRDRYNTQMKSMSCGDDTPKWLPSFQQFNSIIVIITTIVIIVVIFISIIILYKVSYDI
ncbi:variable surface protein, partial [Plasmodium gonderi]